MWEEVACRRSSLLHASPRGSWYGVASGTMLSRYHVVAHSSMWIIGASRVFLMLLEYYSVFQVLSAWSPNVLGIGIWSRMGWVK